MRRFIAPVLAVLVSLPCDDVVAPMRSRLSAVVVVSGSSAALASTSCVTPFARRFSFSPPHCFDAQQLNSRR
jgi:hypothetical protein